jgi:hypothetical protein
LQGCWYTKTAQQNALGFSASWMGRRLTAKGGIKSS